MKNKTKYILSICIFTVCLLLVFASSVLVSLNENLWWTTIVSLTLLFVSILIICCVYFKNTEFICPHCKTQFKPKTITAIKAIHIGRLRYLKCPNCNKKGWCKDKFIEKENKTIQNNS